MIASPESPINTTKTTPKPKKQHVEKKKSEQHSPKEKKKKKHEKKKVKSNDETDAHDALLNATKSHGDKKKNATIVSIKNETIKVSGSDEKKNTTRSSKHHHHHHGATSNKTRHQHHRHDKTSIKNETATKSKKDDSTLQPHHNKTKPTISPNNETIIEDEPSPTSDEQTEPKPTPSPTKPTSLPPPTVQDNNTSSSGSLIPPYNETKALEFTNSSCLLSLSEWFPSSPLSNEWQLRAPRFMIVGARNAGVNTITSQLLKHSQIIPNSHANQKVGYFSQPSFLKNTGRIHVWKARQQLYARSYPLKLLRKNSSLYTMDATPDYLFYSPISRSILCVTPWVKLVVILSNPTLRVYKDYLRAPGWQGSFQDYIGIDMETMERAGLIGASKTREEDAWKLYLSQTTDGPVGRSFYEIQLSQWFHALENMGRNPSEAVHVICLEDWKSNPHEEYTKLLKFLKLPLDESAMPTTASLSTQSALNISEQDEKTMTRLHKFFRPYNKRLYGLVGKDWEHCWQE